MRVEYAVNVAFRRFGLTTITLLYAGALVFAVSLLWLYGGTVKDTGWTWETTRAGVVIASVDPQGPANALSTGAHVVSVNGDRRAAQVGPRPWLQFVAPGQTYRIEWQTTDKVIHQAALPMARRRAEHDLEMG